ncbi:ribosomal protein S6 kinase alpha-5 isoform X3 [Folsomia candida]|uniref:ribosomal protein S6 kinase alpha-5 isoform X3 n=1 Tax=Folsomia candida TaxID=158441 RepID=UPI000B90857A|nr:ribosomal protein S6 kinase alpha-5 isoform X3 [Folsomia candida]
MAILKVNLTGNKGRVDMSNFELLKVLGTGAYGKVFLVRKVGGFDHAKLYAMKVLKKAAIVQKKKTTEHTKTERQVLEAVRESPFLVTLHYAFQTDAKLHLILDYVSGGELFTHLYQRERFTVDQVRIYIGEIVLALEHLHKLGIIYRDIKLENILLDADGHIVLTDFGLSKEFLPHEKEHRTYSFCGTIEYMSPEIVKGGNIGHDFAVDWWSVGVLTYELLTGASPFTVEGEKNTQQEISRRILKIEPPIPDDLSPPVKDFICKMLIKEPRQRLGGGPTDATEVKSHAFFKGINWVDMADKKIKAPFVPKIQNELDTSNFAEEFTKMVPTDSPAIAVPPNFDKIFKGYSYIAPSILFCDKNNVIKDEILRQSQEMNYNFPIANSPFFDLYEIDLKSGILGDGSFSICRRCVKKSTGKEYAVKIVSRKVDSSNEVALLRLCQGHENIVKLHNVYHDEAHAYIVLELLKGGELLDRIRQKERFTEDEASQIMRKLVHAVHFMHSKGIVHRDLKPENLLFVDDSEDSEIKIVDFGFARFKPTEKETMKTPCFTLHYAAPEVLRQAMNQNDEGYGSSCDIWSLGVILYTMLSGRAPFQARSREDSAAAIMARIKGGQFDFNGTEWQHVSPQAKNVTKGMLTVEPTKRLRMEDLLENLWLEGGMGGLLATPSILIRSHRGAETAVGKTFNAFHMAQKEGFRLQDIASSKSQLAQRRKIKKSTDGRSSSSSNFSSASSLSGGSCGVSKGSDSNASSTLSKRSSNEQEGPNFFTFGEARVQEYISSLPERNSNSFSSNFHSSTSFSGSSVSSISNASSARAVHSRGKHPGPPPLTPVSTFSFPQNSTDSTKKVRTTPPTLVAIHPSVPATQTVPVEVKLPVTQTLVTQTKIPTTGPSFPPTFKFEPIMTRARKRRIDQGGRKGDLKSAYVKENPATQDDKLFNCPIGGDVLKPVDLALPSRVRQQQQDLLPEPVAESIGVEFHRRHHHPELAISPTCNSSSVHEGPTQKYKRKRMKNL